MLQKKNILALIDYIFCAILSFAITAAPYYINEGTCKFSLGYIMSVIVSFLLLIGVTYAIRYYLNNKLWPNADKTTKVSTYLDTLYRKKYAILYITIIILAAWIIPLVFLYPGTIINDTWGQLQQFISYMDSNGTLSDHHPIFDTMVMGILIVPLSKLTGKWHMVMFLYVLLQAVLTSLAFANTVSYVYKKLRLGSRITTGMLLVYCVLPIFPASVQTISKDSFHSWGFVFFATYFIEIVRTKGTKLKDNSFLFKLILSALFCCLTKKIGVYVILLSLLMVFVFQKRNRFRLLIPILCTVLLMNIIMPVVNNAFQIIPGGKQEMLSLPFQMTARYVTNYEDEITEEEYIVLDKVLTMEDLVDRYDPINADPVKDYYQKGEDSDYVEYIKVWLKQGLKHPGTYIAAFNNMVAGWFSWDEYDPVMNMDWRSQLNTDIIPEWVATRGFSEKIADAYQELYHNLYEIPVLQIILSYAFYASLIPAFVFCTVFRRWKIQKNKYWLAVLPSIFSIILGCWLAPVSIQLEGKRYLYPVVYTAPLLLMWCVYIYKINKRNTSECE